MSVVTSCCVLCTDNLFDPSTQTALEALGFVRLDPRSCGGNKALQAEIYTAAFNYMTTDYAVRDSEGALEVTGEDVMLRKLKALKWEKPARFFIHRENDEGGWSPWEETGE